jgi:hypothetical protein
MGNNITAVSWLVAELLTNGNLKISLDGLVALSKKALEIEKEQIEEAYWASYKEGQYSGDKTAEEYYNETYGKDNE